VRWAEAAGHAGQPSACASVKRPQHGQPFVRPVGGWGGAGSAGTVTAAAKARQAFSWPAWSDCRFQDFNVAWPPLESSAVALFGNSFSVWAKRMAPRYNLTSTCGMSSVGRAHFAKVEVESSVLPAQIQRATSRCCPFLVSPPHCVAAGRFPGTRFRLQRAPNGQAHHPTRLRAGFQPDCSLRVKVTQHRKQLLRGVASASSGIRRIATVLTECARWCG
jgi:hypothetical protein